MDTAPIACEHCHAKLKVKRKHQGKTFRCPNCGEPITVPEFLFPPEYMTESQSGDHPTEAHSMSDAAKSHQSESDTTSSADPINDSHTGSLRSREGRKQLKLGLDTPVSPNEPTAEEIASQAQENQATAPETQAQVEGAEAEQQSDSQTETLSNEQAPTEKTPAQETESNDDFFETMNQKSDGALDLSKLDDDEEDAFIKHGLTGTDTSKKKQEEEEEKPKPSGSTAYQLGGAEISSIELDMPEPEPEPTKEEIEAKAAEELAAQEAERAEEEAKKKKNFLSGFMKKKEK